MLNKVFGSVDFGKLTVNSVSGFISGVALLLLVDAFTPGRLVESILNEKPAGIIVVEILIVIAGSYAFGLLVDNIYHTFGRWFSSKIWKPLQTEFNFRNCLMENLGLSKAEFEWVQSKDAKAVNEVETKYLRYTEVAGSSAYATMLLGIAVAPFLHFEYQQELWKALIATAAFGLIAILLLVTSAAALAKYERNKTASAMDEIRSMSSHNLTFKEYDRDKGHFTPCAGFLILFFLGILIIPSMVINPLSAKYFDPISYTKVISVLNSDGSVPTLELKVTAKEPAPDTTVNCTLVTLAESVEHLQPVVADNTTYITLTGETTAPERPPWNLIVSLSGVIPSNNTVLLSAEFSSAYPVRPGVWQYPVMVADGDGNEYLLAYVKVTITAASTSATTVIVTGNTTSETRTETTNTTLGDITTTATVISENTTTITK
jgi:hypothetical protein